MKHVAKLLALALATTGGTLIAMEAPALAYPGCERFATGPRFSGHNISGTYRVECSRRVPTATLHGRIKEDRSPLQPDRVIDHESFSFTNTKKDDIETRDCNNGDHIFIEAQINDESPVARSSKKEMNCSE